MSTNPALILVTGATGKVGQAFLPRFLADPAFAQFEVRALCHNRLIPTQERVAVVRGSLSERETARACLEGVTHVVHMAHVKETPEQVMDVAVKGLFWLLEECRASETFQQFILIGGDNAVGHCIVPHAAPVTETMGHSPYPGCYALAKVLEEVMLEQYYFQYGLNGCCLRAPWIMEKDDFKQTLSFGEDVFGGPRSARSGGGGARRPICAGRYDPGPLRCAGDARSAQLRARGRSCQRHPSCHRQPEGPAADLQHLHG